MVLMSRIDAAMAADRITGGANGLVSADAHAEADMGRAAMAAGRPAAAHRTASTACGTPTAEAAALDEGSLAAKAADERERVAMATALPAALNPSIVARKWHE